MRGGLASFMFGIYRYVLAHMVVLAHLCTTSVWWTGYYAVFCFYLLSGYLMTHVLNQRYGFSRSGFIDYITNRVFRIYPSYWVIFLFSLTVTLFIPQAASRAKACLFTPRSVLDWLENIFIFGLDFNELPRLIPPGWSIYVELVFYIMLGLFLARSHIVASVWLITALIITVILVMLGYKFEVRYSTVLGAFLPFSIGAVLYHFKDQLRWLAKGPSLFTAVTLFVAHAFLAEFLWVDSFNMLTSGLYTSLALGAWLTLCLSYVDKNKMPSWLLQTDRWLGDLAYPVFLCHWPVAAISGWLLFGNTIERGWTLFFASLAPINLLSLLVYLKVERRMEYFREAIHIRSSQRLEEGRSC